MNNAIIEKDLTVDGDLLAKDSIVAIEGRVTGNVSAKGVDIRPGGEVRGQITAETVSIGGTLIGGVKCTELTLQDTAQVEADLSVDTIVTNKGAKLVGRVDARGTQKPA